MLNLQARGALANLGGHVFQTPLTTEFTLPQALRVELSRGKTSFLSLPSLSRFLSSCLPGSRPGTVLIFCTVSFLGTDWLLGHYSSEFVKGGFFDLCLKVTARLWG